MRNKFQSIFICATVLAIAFYTRTMHLLHGVGASAKMPVFWHFVCIIVAIHTE